MVFQDLNLFPNTVLMRISFFEEYIQHFKTGIVYYQTVTLHMQ